MFKLESYITPIILNHVAKYVKNIRPRDAQVSLWEGEVAFQNLDLRLDVLEEELNLPFVFLSGHIHELTIHVPWTKITSEPINVTINTIEFVLKLKDQNNDDVSSSSTSLLQPNPITENQQGFMPGLVNKIINNIAINCHNIILKYVEEDIVVSMNVQLLSLHSANEEWQPAFIEINPLKFLLRKIIQISDLTICLDKRNSLGQIEVCQEPILYRCSLELRILHSTETEQITQIGISTKLMEINISSVQFPMAMRLIALTYALKSGKLKKQSNVNVENKTEEQCTEIKTSNDSYLTWAFSFLPTFSFDYEDEKIIKKKEIGNIIDIGIYIGYLQITLKSTEFIIDSIVSTTRKIKYNSILKIILAGIYNETLIANDKNWFNTKGGIGKITVEPLGNHAIIEFGKYIISSDTDTLESYLDNSLFDTNALNKEKNFITNPNKYLEIITDDYLRHRGSCIAFDMVDFKDIPKREKSDNSILDIALDNIKNKTRLFLSSIHFRYNLPFLKIYDTIKNLSALYDYVPYTNNNLTTQKTTVISSPSPLQNQQQEENREENACYNENIFKNYEFTINNIKIDLLSRNEIYLLHSNKDNKLIKKYLNKLKYGKLPYIIIEINYINGQWIMPHYLKYTTPITSASKTKLPNDLLNVCYDNYNITLKNIALKLKGSGSNFKIITIPKITLNLSKIIKEPLLMTDDTPIINIKLNIYTINMKFNRPQFYIIIMLFENLCNLNYFNSYKILKTNARNDLHNNLLKCIENILTDVELNLCIYKNITRTCGHIKSFQSNINSIINDNDILRHLVFQSIENLTNNLIKKRWIQWACQIPNNIEKINIAPFVAIDIDSFYVIISSTLIEFLNYTNIELESETEAIIEQSDTHGILSDSWKEKKSIKSIISDRFSRKIPFPQETVHLSSEKDERNKTINLIETPFSTSSTKNNKLFLNAIKIMQVNIEINPGVVCILNNNVESISEVLKSNNLEYMELKLPKILCKSALTEELSKSCAFNTINIQKINIRETFPWKCAISDLNIKNITKSGKIIILHSVITNITFHIRNKKETIELTKHVSTSKHQTKHQTKVVKQKQPQQQQQQDQQNTLSIDKDDQSFQSNYSIHSQASGISQEVFDDELNESTDNQKMENNNIAMTRKQNTKEKLKLERENVAIDLHIDTTPIFIEIPIKEIEKIHQRFTMLFKAINSWNCKTHEPIILVEDNILIVTNLEEDPSVKELLEFETNSQLSNDLSNKHPSLFVLTILLQWTITKFVINLEGYGQRSTKLTIDLEDLITSLDKQYEFTKIKSKIGTLSVKYYELNERNEWLLNDSLRVKMGTDNLQSPYLNCVITFAEKESFFKKIGAKNKFNDINKTLSEIIISTQSIEILLDLDRLTEFMPLFCELTNQNIMENDKHDYNNEHKKPLLVIDLPLIYLDSKGFTIYSPVKMQSEMCSVFILKIEDISLTTKVDNPLDRLPIRPDIYNKAAQMGILNTPGSIIEDRQYEIIFKKISAATGNWNDILIHMKDNTDNFHNTNPAFDWNNKNYNKNQLVLQAIFANVIVSIIYAPCIAYNNILVCGEAIEVNFLSDLVASLTTNQLMMMSCMMVHFSNLKKLTCKKSKPIDVEIDENQPKLQSNMSTDSYLSCADTFNSPKLSTYEKLKQHTIKQNLIANQTNQHGKIPFDLSFVGGIFILKLYKLIKMHSLKENILGHECKVDIEENLKPLIAFTIHQPSLLISQKVYDNSIQITLYNFEVNLNHLSRSSEKENMKEFPVAIFNTKRGVLSVTGIPPSLVTIKVNQTKLKKCEIYCDIAKPCKFQLSHKIIENLANIWVELNEAVMSNLCYYKTRPVVRGSKIQMMHHLIFNSDKFSLKIKKIIIEIFQTKEYEIKNVLTDLKCSLNFVKRLDKMNLKASIGAFYMQTKSKIFLHPLAIKLYIDLQQENWQKLPLMKANVFVNVIHADVGVQNIKNFTKFINNLKETLEITEQLLNDLDENIKSKKKYINIHNTNLKSEILPELTEKKSIKSKDEFYRDDLRAGAFQFIEIDNDSSLPMPYQIQIIKKNYGVICWRYPQPRKICNLHIYPIPMPIANPSEIKCQLQYYSETHRKFLNFCDFFLSETESNQIELPERLITANIWRVKILQTLVSVDSECFDVNDDDDTEMIIPIKIEDMLNGRQNDEFFKLHPKVLVGCMRIDTVFNPDIVQKIELFIDIARIEINLQTQQRLDCKLPSPLRQFTIKNSFAQNETFISFLISNIEMHMNYWNNEHFSIYNEMGMHIKCLDYGFYSLQYLMDETHIKSFIEFNEFHKNINIISDAVTLNFGPEMAHTLVTSINQWYSHYDDNNQYYPIFTRFIVANRADIALDFGQDGTNERLRLNRQQCTMYSFHSDNYEQKLVFYANDSQDISEGIPFCDDDQTIKYIHCGKYLLIGRTKKLSSTQLIIFIKGQIEIVSMVENEFNLQFRKKNSDLTDSLEEIDLLSRDRNSICMKIFKDTEITFRLKFRSKEIKSWSGDIPLKSNKNLPWLVKVPVSGPNDFVSYWIRVFRQDIPELATSKQTPQRVLIFLWPIFEIRSMYPAPLSMRNNDSMIYQMTGDQGNSLQLELPATHETNHNIYFTDTFEKQIIDKRLMSITLKDINWNEFFHYDTNLWLIDEILADLSKLKSNCWPVNDEEELLINRKIEQKLHTMPISKILSGGPTACSVIVEISPWCYCINSLALPIRIKNCDTDECLIISPNSISEVFEILNGFVIEIETLTGRWLSSATLYFNNTNIISLDKYDNMLSKYVLNDNEHITIILESLKGYVYKLILKNVYENGRRILIVKPKFIIVNFTKHLFQLVPFCLRDIDKITCNDVMNVIEKSTFEVSKHIEGVNCKGLTLEYFHYMSVQKYRKHLNLADIRFFVCLKSIKGTEITIPISLSTTCNRICFNLKTTKKSIALCASVLEKNGQHYLNIFDDLNPAVIIRNETDLNFYIAQANLDDNHANAQYSSTSLGRKQKRITVKPECNEKYFDWYQILRGRSYIYYTPSEMYSNFPEISKVTPNISIAILNGSNNTVFTNTSIRWSLPIGTTSSCEKFFHLPLHGDVKVIVCDQHKCIKISIFYIAQQLEFSVKDLRSRLQSPSSGLNSSFHSDLTEPDSFITNEQNKMKNIEKSGSSCNHNNNKILEQCQQQQKLHTHLFIKQIVINLFTLSKKKLYMKTEMCSAYIDDMHLIYNANNHTGKLFISNLQIDNQLFSDGNYDFPVVLCSEESYNRNKCIPSIYKLMNDFIKSRIKNDALITIQINFYSNNIEMRSIQCQIKPIRTYFEDSYLNILYDKLLDLLPTNVAFLPHNINEREQLIDGYVIVPIDIKNQAIYLAKTFKLQSIEIAPMSVLLSAHTCMHIYIALDHSPLEFSSYEQQNFLTLPINLGYTLGKHYISGALFGAGWVVGSLEILGSPSGLARSFQMGLRDFISMPVQGLLSGPWGLIVGITQGSVSLLRNITAGTVNSVTKLAASVARNIDRFTLDDEHFQRTEALRRYRPNGFAEGFSQGLTGLGISILGALGGISRHPLEAKSSFEVVTGLGRGIVGAFTKPISGAAELVALTGQGVLHTVGFNSMPIQREISTLRNISLHPAEGKVWKVLPTVLISDDQILFYNEATLCVGNQLRKVMICVTSSILAVLDSERDELAYIMSIEKIQIDFDKDDNTLMTVRVIESVTDDFNEGVAISFTKQRIMSFLKSSEQDDDHTKKSITWESLEDMLISEHKDVQLDLSFYISKPYGKHLLDYIKILQSKEHS